MTNAIWAIDFYPDAWAQEYRQAQRDTITAVSPERAIQKLRARYVNAIIVAITPLRTVSA
jgi:hypothetical protein